MNVAPWPAPAAKIARDTNDLQQNSLRSGTGNFSEQNREMELPNRELFAANRKRPFLTRFVSSFSSRSGLLTDNFQVGGRDGGGSRALRRVLLAGTP